MNGMDIQSFEDFAQFVKTAKGQRRLHKLVEGRLSWLLSRLYPESCPVEEVSGVPGGRNDLIQFFSNGRRFVFELFFSPSQVPQNLRLLEQSVADVKIAVLLDRQIDPRLATEYFRKKPDHFPYLWLSQATLPRYEAVCLARLVELIDEDSSIRRLRRILSTPAGRRLEEPLRRQMERIEGALSEDGRTDRKVCELTNHEVVALRVIAKIRDMGVPVERLRSLYAWLHDEEVMRHAFTLVVFGFQAFLVTDLDGQHPIWSDGDMADDVILGAENSERASVVVCLNKFINDALAEGGHEKRALSFHFFHTYAEHLGKIVPAWETDDEAGSR